MPKRARAASSLPDLVRRSVAESAASLEKAAAGFEETHSGEALHGVRVSLRRLAAVARVFHGFPCKGDGAVVEDLAHELRRDLSPAREREVSKSLVHRLSGEDTEPSREALAALALDRPHTPPPIGPGIAQVVTLLRAWNRALSEWAPSADDVERLEKKVKKRLKSTRRRVLEVGLPGRRTLHRLRVSGKALRYALELVSGVVPGAAALLKASRKLQDALGEANDWAALHRTLRDVRPSAPHAARATLDRLAPVVEEERARSLDSAKREARRFNALLAKMPVSLEPPTPARAARSRRSASARPDFTSR
jgi:CHAD domain-containing protein